MSIVKDLLPLCLFLILIIKYILLYQKIIKQRNYFINTLSHDLRVSTIAQIRGLELLQRNNKFQDSNAELVSEINNSCKFTLDMITMLLNRYQFESNNDFLNFEKFNLSEMVSYLCKNFSEKILDKNLSLHCDYKWKGVVDGDKTALSKVISTLLVTASSNAEKGTTIRLVIQKNNTNAQISILYNGNSLTEEECRRMFEDNPRFSTVGHGIKMNLCKKIIEFHKGKIFLKICGENLNCFTFRIPIEHKKTSFKIPLQRVLQPY